MVAPAFVKRINTPTTSVRYALLVCLSLCWNPFGWTALAEPSIAQALSAEMIYPAPTAPQSNPSSQAKIELGQQLFHEVRLSSTSTHACATCHKPALHFTDGLPRAIGVDGTPHRFNTPTLYNVGLNSSLGWQDQGVSSLEAQHLIPLTNQQPVEMGYSEALLQTLLSGVKYQTLFQAAFPESKPQNEFTTEHLVKAIASYVRTIRPAPSRFDAYLFLDDPAALDAIELSGMQLFFSERLGCSHCHANLTFSGPITSAGVDAEPIWHVTGVNHSSEAFRAPTLRRIAHTAPYMHDGSLRSLDEVIDHYQNTNSTRVPDFVLTQKERNALIAFLGTL